MLAPMLRAAVLSALATLFVLPLSASGQELAVQTAVDGPLLQSGLAAVERLSSPSSENVTALQAQYTALNNSKTIIVVIAVVAIAALVLIPYTKSHERGGPIITLY